MLVAQHCDAATRAKRGSYRFIRCRTHALLEILQLCDPFLHRANKSRYFRVTISACPKRIAQLLLGKSGGHIAHPLGGLNTDSFYRRSVLAFVVKKHCSIASPFDECLMSILVGLVFGPGLRVAWKVE